MIFFEAFEIVHLFYEPALETNSSRIRFNNIYLPNRFALFATYLQMYVMKVSQERRHTLARDTILGQYHRNLTNLNITYGNLPLLNEQIIAGSTNNEINQKYFILSVVFLIYY